MRTPLEMREYAVATGTTEYQDGLTVSPEGQFFICGRRCTLNDAILYGGNRKWFKGLAR